MRVIDYGGIIVSLRTPDHAGNFADIVLGFDDLEGYVKSSPYFGAIAGRYANRIAKGQFALDGTTYKLAVNNGPNALHGGLKGFDKVVWQAEPGADSSGVHVMLRYTSANGEEGYPGTLHATVTYTLTDGVELAIEYQATTDKPTPINLTNHSYFNLAGEGSGTVLGEVVTIDADRYVPVDTTFIPTGELASVAGTPFDFRKPTAIGARIDQPDPQLKNGHGYDHNFVLNRPAGGAALVHAAHVVDATSGRTLDVATTEPGVQFYTGNFLDGKVVGKSGHAYPRRGRASASRRIISRTRLTSRSSRPRSCGLAKDVSLADGVHVRRSELVVIPSGAPQARSRGIAVVQVGVVIPSGAPQARSRGIAVIPIEGFGSSRSRPMSRFARRHSTVRHAAELLRVHPRQSVSDALRRRY